MGRRFWCCFENMSSIRCVSSFSFFNGIWVYVYFSIDFCIIYWNFFMFRGVYNFIDWKFGCKFWFLCCRRRYNVFVWFCVVILNIYLGFNCIFFRLVSLYYCVDFRYGLFIFRYGMCKCWFILCWSIFLWWNIGFRSWNCYLILLVWCIEYRYVLRSARIRFVRW